MLQKFYTFILLLIFVPQFNWAQELPPIVKYPTAVYAAGNQNWMMGQDEHKFMYFANNEGLLEFNGSHWQLYPSPNETILRSVKVIDNKIFTGCYMEFGFWQRNPWGMLQYESLSQKCKDKIFDDEQFWNILQIDHWVIFQSLNQIFIYNSLQDSFNIITPKSPITKAFVVDQSVYFHTLNTGLYTIENGIEKLVSNLPFFSENKIITIIKENETLVLLTQFHGFYELKNGTISKKNIPVDPLLEGLNIYCALPLKNGDIALGTVSNGVIIINKQGENQFHVSQSSGLSNNTALSLFEDKNFNLWIGLDNGINCINLQSPIKIYADNTGNLGTVYTAVKFEETTYIGTNQGLFYKNKNTNHEFKIIKGTNGQVWNLWVYDNTLFCGHDAGTFIIENFNAKKIYNQAGTWKFSPHPIDSTIIFQGNYTGISTLKKIKGKWQFNTKIEGFDYSTKYFEFVNPQQIIVSHEYKGVFKIELDTSLKKVIHYRPLPFPEKGKNAGLAKFNNKVYYGAKDGVFVYDHKSSAFYKDTILSQVFQKDEYISGKFMTDQAQKLWFFTKNYINYFSYGTLSDELKHHVIPIPSNLSNALLGYENCTQIGSSQYLIGTTDGYYTMDINTLDFQKPKLWLTHLWVNQLNEKAKAIKIAEKGDFKFAENNFIFQFTVPTYHKYINAEYSYILEGFHNSWSPWNSQTELEFKNLPPGTYTLKVKAKIGNTLAENDIIYEFAIAKPWYATNIALILYALLLLVIAFFINKAYKKHYTKQQNKLIQENKRIIEIKELENQQEVMRLKNEKLENDFESKNRELAASTMSLIKKNELLAQIKDELKKSTEGQQLKNVKSVITTINKNINEEDTWNVFKDAFNNVDKDFLKKIKQLHPSLTPNDLRLCAYLRLNLSSKEIAPLLNISIRSVEIKRYRLRKKMELPHEQGLVEYILGI